MSESNNKKSNKYGKRYTPTFRKKIVEEIENGDKTFSEVLREYNLNDSTVCRWLRLYRTEGEEGLLKIKKGGRKKENSYKKRGQEILEKQKYLNQQEELRLLRMQNEYYKKVIEVLTEDGKKKNQTTNKKPK